MNTAPNMIKDAYADIDAAQRAVSVEEVFHRAGPVRPLDELSRERGSRAARRPSRWLPVAVGLSAMAAIVALVAIPFIFRSAGDNSPPAIEPMVTVTTEATVSTTTADEISQDDVDAADGAWTRFPADVDLGWAFGFFTIDDVYLRFDSSARFTAEGDDPDPKSYVWISEDGDAWTRQELPDAVPLPAVWSWSRDTETVGVGGPYVEDRGAEWEFARFAATIDRSADSPRLVLDPIDQDDSTSADPVAVLPDMSASGLTPVAEAHFDAGWGQLPLRVDVGDVSLLPGAIGFEFPDDVVERLPESNGGNSCCGSAEARTGGTARYEFDGELVYEEVWSVEGQRVSVEVIVYDDDGAGTTIHTGWADLPDDLVVFSSGHYGSTGFPIDVVWRSTDGGSTYEATQLGLAVSDDAQWGPGMKLIAHGGRFLWYVEPNSNDTFFVYIWSSQDGLQWELEADNVGPFHAGNMVRHGNILLAPSESGAFVSTDGIEWNGVRMPSTQTEIVVMDAGFATWSDAVHLSADGETWMSLSLPESLGRPYEDYSIQFVGDLIIVQSWKDGWENSVTWIGRLPEG